MVKSPVFWCDDDVGDSVPYNNIGAATTIPKDQDYVAPAARPIGFIWPESID